MGSLRVTFTLFLPFALGYFLSYLFRTLNAIIAGDLASAAGTDAAGLGLLTSAYFASFAAFQIPLGLLLDRFGPRRVEAALLTVAAAGAFLFAAADSLVSMALARAVIGLGVSGCLMGAMKNALLWWPRERVPLINGLVLASGGLGALAATTPLAALVHASDWRTALQVVGALTLAAAAYLWLAVPEPASRPGAAATLGEQLAGVRRVFAAAEFWRLAPVAVAVQSVFLAYQGLWSAAWLADVSAVPAPAVADYLQTIPVAMILGYVATGLLAERLGRVGIGTEAVTRSCVLLFLVVLALFLVPGLDWPVVQWGAFGFLATASMLTYPMLAQAFPQALAGRVITALNVLAFVGAFAVQAGVGAVLDRFPAAAGSGAAASGHRTAMAILAGATALAFAWSLRRRKPA